MDGRPSHARAIGRRAMPCRCGGPAGYRGDGDHAGGSRSRRYGRVAACPRPGRPGVDTGSGQLRRRPDRRGHRRRRAGRVRRPARGAGPAPVRGKGMNDATILPHEIRGVLIPISGARLLLPNATVSEVITLSTPEPIPGAPDWLLGRVGWRGWRLPLVAFSTLAGLPEPEGELNSRVTV